MTIGPSLTLKRLQVRDDGCFSILTKDDDGSTVCVAAERTFGENGAPTVVVPAGRYRCVRGLHSLNGINFFHTYEVTGVLGHTGILFHPGNTELDSKGCVLTGRHFGAVNNMMAVIDSRLAFNDFLALQGGAEEFWLTVV